MKNILFVTLTIVAINLKAQIIESPRDAVVNLFVATDQQNWNAVEDAFDTKVLLDYSSINGNPAAELSPAQIIAAWKGILPGFESTHHQLGNFQIESNGKLATVFCYGTASHSLNDENGNLWTVVGTYDFDLVMNESDVWKIKSMKFNFKYQDGNTSLPEKAINNLK